MVFQLITDTQEFLSSFSFPTTFCTICLEGFNNKVPFLKTNCFHIFHEKCLAKWYAIKFEDAIIDLATPRYNRKELKDPVWCPTCRDPIDESIVRPFFDLVEKKTKHYRLRLAKEQEEERRKEEQWKLERELERKKDPKELLGEKPTVEIAYAAIFDS